MSVSEKLMTEALEQGSDIWVFGAATPDQISSLELALGLPLSPSYVRFLQRYGAVAAGDMVVSGIIGSNVAAGSALGDTRRLRDEMKLPEAFVVISVHEDGGYCLDTSKATPGDEYPVVNYEFGSNQHGTPVARDFEDWFVRFFLPCAIGE
jgi:hypothetical protein